MIPAVAREAAIGERTIDQFRLSPPVEASAMSATKQMSAAKRRPAVGMRSKLAAGIRASAHPINRPIGRTSGPN